MKKITLITALLIISATLFAQQKDTVYVPYYLYEKTDTVKIISCLYGKRGRRLVTSSPAYQVQKGFKYVDQNNKWQWLKQPAVSGYLDSKKKKIDLVLQVTL